VAKYQFLAPQTSLVLRLLVSAPKSDHSMHATRSRPLPQAVLQFQDAKYIAQETTLQYDSVTLSPVTSHQLPGTDSTVQ
jgi:hypothetical protein